MVSEKNLVLSLEEILDFDYSNKNILIIGNAGTGKTWLSKKICNGTHIKVHTDDFIPMGYEQAAYSAIEAAMNIIGRSCTEGIQGFRMLRKGYEESTYKPDIVIHIEISSAKQEEIYRSERDPNKIAGVKAQNKANTTILNKYFDMVPVEELPLFIHFNNSY